MLLFLHDLDDYKFRLCYERKFRICYLCLGVLHANELCMLEFCIFIPFL